MVIYVFTVDFQTIYEKNLEEELLELYKSHYNKYKEEWTKMKLDFKQQTENVDISSEQNYQFHLDHNEKLHCLKTEFKRKLEKEKEHYMEVSKENRECCICSSKLCCDDAMPLLCGHDEFHENCMKIWLKEKKTCPICRADCTATGTYTAEALKPFLSNLFPRVFVVRNLSRNS